MIPLTRLNGDEFILNCDMIERVEATPDTHILLTDGTRYVVKETPVQVIREAQIFRAGVLAMVGHVESVTEAAVQAPRGGLAVVLPHSTDGR